MVAVTAAVLLLPVMALIALLIRILDPGPAVFCQQRIGEGGRAFTLYKFRSMPVGTANVPSAAADSLELTRIGRFIRRTNFDELPQLLNILKGDMSVVGPRPAIKSQSELIALRQANGALACRPGLTGLAQVSSYDGMTDVQKAVFDGEYARSVSLAVDLRIIVRTVTYLLKPPPRY
jgi:O-antigen biosynthesis protein WbqP